MVCLGLMIVVLSDLAMTAPVKDGWLVEIGQDAPQFELKDVDGTLHKLSDYAGSVVVLAFWDTY